MLCYLQNILIQNTNNTQYSYTSTIPQVAVKNLHATNAQVFCNQTALHTICWYQLIQKNLHANNYHGLHATFWWYSLYHQVRVFSISVYFAYNIQHCNAICSNVSNRSYCIFVYVTIMLIIWLRFNGIRAKIVTF